MNTRAMVWLRRLLVTSSIVFLTSCNVNSQNPPGKDSKPPIADSKYSVAKPPLGPVIDIPTDIVTGMPNEARVKEIASRLQSAPSGLGKPITDRAAWAAAFPNPEAFINSAEQMAKEPTPELPDALYLLFTQKGSRREYEAPYAKRITRLNAFVLAECIENKGRFLSNIESELGAILNEKTWTMPAHDGKLEAFNDGKHIVDLGVCMRAWDIATIDHILGAKLRPETRAKIRSEANRRILDPYKKIVLQDFSTASKGSKWWLTTTNNWNAVCHAGVIGTALALLPTPEERAWYLAAMEIYIPNFLAGFTPDGYCTEGIGYWNYGFGHYVAMAETVGEATKWYMNLYAPKRISNILYFPKRLELLPNIYPAYADCSASAKPDLWIYQVAGRQVVTPTPLPSSRPRVAANSFFMYQMMICAFGDFPDSSKVEQVGGSLPIRDRFPDAGIAIGRTSQNSPSKGFALCIKAGHNNEHHNHNDVGSFVIGLNGKTPILDPGSEIYTKRTFSSQRYESQILNSYGHSVPVVAGKLQDTGEAARGTVTVLETSDAKDSYLLDIKAAYIKSVPSLKKLTRHVTFTRTPKPSAEITDEVEFDSPQTFGDAILTFGKCEQNGANTFLIYDGDNAVKVKVDTEGKAFSFKDEFLEGNLASSYKARRLGFNLNEPVTHARIRYTIEPTDSPTNANPALDKNLGEARKPHLKEGIVVEAEKFADQKGGTVDIVVKDSTSGQAIRLWDKDGHELSWKFKVPNAGTYGLLLRYSNGATGDAKRSLLVDGKNIGGVQGDFTFPPTGGWGDLSDQWKEGWLAQSKIIYGITLSPGDHTITLKNAEGGGLNLDWLSLVPLEK